MKKATRKKALKKVPEFKSEAEAAAFWQSHDTTDYLDWNQAQRVIFPNLKPSNATQPVQATVRSPARRPYLP